MKPKQNYTFTVMGFNWQNMDMEMDLIESILSIQKRTTISFGIKSNGSAPIKQALLPSLDSHSYVIFFLKNI